MLIITFLVKRVTPVAIVYNTTLEKKINLEGRFVFFKKWYNAGELEELKRVV